MHLFNYSCLEALDTKVSTNHLTVPHIKSGDVPVYIGFLMQGHIYLSCFQFPGQMIPQKLDCRDQSSTMSWICSTALIGTRTPQRGWAGSSTCTRYGYIKLTKYLVQCPPINDHPPPKKKQTL